jgi:hypothetical protein
MKSISMKLLFFALLIALGACTSPKNSCDSTAEKATLEDFTGLDGCGYLIVLKDGTRLEPINLNSQTVAPADGKKVWLTYTTAKNTASICMVGEIVEITCMSER